MNVGLELGHPLVVVGVEKRHQAMPHREDGEDVPQHRGHVQHQVGRHQPQCHHHCDLGRVLRVAGSWNRAHQAHHQGHVGKRQEGQRKDVGQNELVDKPVDGGGLLPDSRGVCVRHQRGHGQVAVLPEVGEEGKLAGGVLTHSLAVDTGRGRHEGGGHEDGGEREREVVLAPLFVPTRVVQEEGDERVVDNGTQEDRVEERVPVGGELPEPAGPVALGPGGNGLAPVHELNDQLGVEDQIRDEHRRGQTVDHVNGPSSPDDCKDQEEVEDEGDADEEGEQHSGDDQLHRLHVLVVGVFVGLQVATGAQKVVICVVSQARGCVQLVIFVGGVETPGCGRSDLHRWGL